MRALLLVNANSRRGAELLDSARSGLKDAGFSPVYVECTDRDDLSPAILRNADKADLIVVGGGDGTLSAAARGVAESGLPMGILPTGTANDLARTLGLPLDLPGAIAVIAEGVRRRIDLGLVNDQPFFNVASLGLSAELAKAITPDIKRRFGRFGYAVAAARVLTRARPMTATITHPGGTERVRTYQIAVGNGVFYGGGNAVAADAAIDDQKLDLYSLELHQLWKLVLMAKSFREGRHGDWAEVRAIRAGEFVVTTRRPRSVNADGELITKTPARFSVWAKALEVFVPRPEDDHPDGAEARG
ncbi:lipid kinase [Zavarzinia sp. CC-PAN008]|uniref:lipid kinase n=1 Tax=Zavarzinia sp. CC-PAN008 TaxID=3243332 RepID=UPI003F7468A9